MPEFWSEGFLGAVANHLELSLEVPGAERPDRPTVAGMEVHDYLWPEPGHSFFEFQRTRPDAYSWMHRSLGEYAFMYRDSAEKLIELACEAPGLLNVHAIPAVFLFRHAVELSLKDMLVDAGRLNGEASSFPDGHGLRNLWKELRTLMAAAGLEENDDEKRLLDVVDEMVHELDTTDPASMSFRYPSGTRKAGRPPLLDDEFEYFDMRVFRDQAKRLAHFLDGCATQLGEYVQIKRDMDAEYAWESGR